ncbi:hypothetical protein LN42_06430 [Marinitoga sp. 1137]|uniref:ImmA/IrrE family metallo-endopeptidase n=1 Tax=Marinitoga sp. 1137 TaxID=1545835 RepID=UPI0009509345|nr:ImmA/IrrE family metallo-endopeptidase [Marinitoga sp. 1137]APT76057.1 hypothetical protein LN42_06430 [Marinitoga sp. 1137]
MEAGVYTKEEIRNFARKLRKLLKFKNPATINKLENIVKTLGGEIIFSDEDLENYAEAKIVKIDDEEKKFRIIVTDKDFLPKERKVFSIAHELGHLFLHMGYIINEEKWNNINDFFDFYYRRDKNYIEYEANEFAGEFLMPEDEFKKIAYENFDEDENAFYIEPIANYFGVSKKAVITRGKFLGLFEW